MMEWGKSCNAPFSPLAAVIGVTHERHAIGDNINGEQDKYQPKDV
jgi:hypothetical protein